MQLKREAKLLTVIGLTTMHAVCRITFMLYPIFLCRRMILRNWVLKSLQAYIFLNLKVRCFHPGETGTASCRELCRFGKGKYSLLFSHSKICEDIEELGVSVLLRLFISSNEVCNTAYALKRIHEQNSILKYTTMGPMILKEMKYNLHYCDVRGDVLPPPYDTNTICNVVK